MKKILVSLITISLISCKTIGQVSIPQVNGNIPNNTLTKFEGTWVWSSGTDTLKIILKKENILLPHPTNSHYDAIVGFHGYKHGNTVLESSLNFCNTPFSDHHSTILGVNFNGNDILRGTHDDISKNKKVEELQLTLNPAQNQLQWILNATEGLKVNEIHGFTLPRSLILVKQ